MFARRRSRGDDKRVSFRGGFRRILPIASVAFRLTISKKLQNTRPPIRWYDQLPPKVWVAMPTKSFKSGVGIFHIEDHVAALFRFAGEREPNLSPDRFCASVSVQCSSISTSMLELDDMCRRASVRGAGLEHKSPRLPSAERQRKAFQRDERTRNPEMRLLAGK